MPAREEFMIAELTLQSELRRRKADLPEVDDNLGEITEDYFKSIFDSKHYLSTLLEGGEMGENDDSLGGFTPEEMEDLVDAHFRTGWSPSYVNSLPDSAFALIETGGKKSEGKTSPFTLRHLAHHDVDGKVDLPHLQESLASISQMKDISEAQRSRAESHLNRHAKAAKIDTKSEDADTINLKTLSFEQQVRMVSSAVSKLKGESGYTGAYWPVATFPDSVVVTDWESAKFSSFPYTIKSGEIEFGEPSVVEQEFVEVPSEQQGMKVLRGEDGVARWMSISSNTYRDSYDERFSAECLDEAVESMEKTDNHGELRMEHHIASRIGLCDYSHRVGNFLIEGGTFDETPVAQAAIKTLESDKEGKFRVSIGYLYNEKYLSEDGVYTGHVRIFERSVTQAPANKLTAISLADLGGKMDKTATKTRLTELVGEDLANEIMTKGDDKLEALTLALGIKVGTKNEELPTPTPVAPKAELPIEIEIVDANGKVLHARREDAEESNADPKDFAAIVKKAVAEAVKPLQEEIAELKSGSRSDDRPRVVRYRITDADTEDEEEESNLTEEEEAEAAALQKERSEEGQGGSFWSAFPGGPKAAATA